MDKLAEVNPENLRTALATASAAKAVKHLMIALAYADGVRVETLSKRYNIPHATVYSWLDRFEHQLIAEAIEDGSRPGRSSKLDPSERERLSDELARSSAELGYDTLKWMPERAQRHIGQVYDITYSLGHFRRVLREHR